jgi:hypothetical protein
LTTPENATTCGYISAVLRPFQSGDSEIHGLDVDR